METEKALGGWVPLRVVMRLLGWSYTKTYNAALAGEMGAELLGGRWHFRYRRVLARVGTAKPEQPAKAAS
jgi:hypothetical protein